MNVSEPGGGPGGGQSQDFDINLAPIIDCFTVLITFMLASASFLAVAIIDASVAASGPPPPGAKPPSIRLDIALNQQKEIVLRVSGKAKMEKKIPAVAGDWNTSALAAELQSIGRQWPDTNSAVLTANDDLEYLNVVRIMEVVKSRFPAILLGGL